MALEEKVFSEKFVQALEQANQLAKKGHINRAMMILEEVLSQKPLLMRTYKKIPEKNE